MIQKIVDTKNQTLRAYSRPVARIDKKILQVIKDLRDTLAAQKDPEGVGLAAPQIGKDLRIFLINYKKHEYVIINPEIIKIEKPKNLKVKLKNKILEGCLSLPHYYSPILRSNKLTLRYLDISGVSVTEEFKSFMAHIIQHEVDHLNGILFIDRVLEQKTPMYKFHGDDWEEVELL